MAKRICMYCNMILGESKAVDQNGVNIDSHGACKKCASEQLEKMRADMKKHLAINNLEDLQKHMEAK